MLTICSEQITVLSILHHTKQSTLRGNSVAPGIDKLDTAVKVRHRCNVALGVVLLFFLACHMSGVS